MTSNRLDRIEKILSLLAEDQAKSEKRMTRLELQIKTLLNIVSRSSANRAQRGNNERRSNQGTSAGH